MRYQPDHKVQTHRRIVESASRQFRAEGMNGPGVAKLMKASGLTHGGFYKHFASKDDLFAEAIEESAREIGAKLTEWGKQVPRDEAWKEIVKKYLSIEHCEHPGMGCPMAALAPDIARTRATVRRKIRDSMDAYRKQLVEFMPGAGPGEKQKNFVLIFTAMVGALAVARTMSDREEKEKLLGLVRNHLLTSF
ncbi:MAG TPA: TetR/AcrR family transcriptional regulator [Terriglobales bacterium]|nr:TetR/AcrR family transcriptional regulator [Terriglobales bacterium]